MEHYSKLLPAICYLIWRPWQALKSDVRMGLQPAWKPSAASDLLCSLLLAACMREKSQQSSCFFNTREHAWLMLPVFSSVNRQLPNKPYLGFWVGSGGNLNNLNNLYNLNNLNPGGSPGGRGRAGNLNNLNNLNIGGPEIFKLFKLFKFPARPLPRAPPGNLNNLNNSNNLYNLNIYII